MANGIFPQPKKAARKLTPEEQRRADELARKQQELMPWWKKAGQGIISGIFGDEPEKQWGPGKISQFATELATMGALPAPALLKKLGITKLFHGSPTAGTIVKEGFNPDMANRGDILGWMTHLAERPSYAAHYAEKGGGLPTSGIIPATVKGTAVDLMNPQAEDVVRVAGVLPPEKRKHIIQAFRNKLRREREGPGATSLGETPLGETLRYEIENLKPEQFERTGIDALRYNDLGEPAWAVPRPHNILGAFTNEPIGGILPREIRNKPPFIAGPEGIIPPPVREVSSKSFNKPSALPWEEIEYETAGKSPTFSHSISKEKWQDPAWAGESKGNDTVVFWEKSSGKNVDEISVRDLNELYPGSTNLDNAIWKYKNDTVKSGGWGPISWEVKKSAPKDVGKQLYGEVKGPFEAFSAGEYIGTFPDYAEFTKTMKSGIIPPLKPGESITYKPLEKPFSGITQKDIGAINSNYTSQDATEVINLAEKLGINYHKMPHLGEVQDAIESHPKMQGKFLLFDPKTGAMRGFFDTETEAAAFFSNKFNKNKNLDYTQIGSPFHLGQKK